MAEIRGESLSTVVLVPYRGDGQHRTRHFRMVVDHLKRFGWPVHVADSGHMPFSLANTFNEAAKQAGKWSRAVLHDADAWISLDRIAEAAATADSLTYCYDRLFGLNEEATHRFTTGLREFTPDDYLRVLPSPKRPLPKGGPRVVTRDVWEQVGGFPAGFVGWGGEDLAFAHMCRLVAGPAKRVRGDMFELWHPRRSDTPNDPYFQAWPRNRALAREIQKLTTREDLEQWLQTSST